MVTRAFPSTQERGRTIRKRDTGTPISPEPSEAGDQTNQTTKSNGKLVCSCIEDNLISAVRSACGVRRGNQPDQPTETGPGTALAIALGEGYSQAYSNSCVNACTLGEFVS